MKVFKEIPQIDLSPVFTDCQKGLYRVSEDIRQAYTEVGFAYIYNHGFPQELIEAGFEAARFFHGLPLEEKMNIRLNKAYRGYMPFQGSILKVSTLGTAQTPNQSAAFILGYEAEKNDPDYIAQINLAGPNQWPENAAHFKKTITEYNEKMLVLARKMVQVFAVAFGLEPNALDHHFIKPSTFLRLQYYPEQPDLIPESQYGIAPHTDYGFLTLLAQDSRGGLQVRNQEGEWIDAPYIPGTLVLNSSDMLKRMTNDVFISTPHRVINRSGKERYSIPFFFEPNMHTEIGILKQFTSKERPAKYPPIEYCNHLMERVHGNYEATA
jgi:isopenicillin N synthase-like dioxygenase